MKKEREEIDNEHLELKKQNSAIVHDKEALAIQHDDY